MAKARHPAKAPRAGEGDVPVALVLAILRTTRGWNQDQLAKAAEVRPSTVSNYETGRQEPGLGNLRRLLAAMGYSLAAIERTKAFIENLGVEGIAIDLPVARSIAPTPEAILFEIEKTAFEVGGAMTRFARLIFLLLRSERTEAAPGKEESK
jgi:transcriptional regulator with XRE-family HTH domain